jgi:hypothetical protein
MDIHLADIEPGLPPQELCPSSTGQAPAERGLRRLQGPQGFAAARAQHACPRDGLSAGEDGLWARLCSVRVPPPARPPGL